MEGILLACSCMSPTITLDGNSKVNKRNIATIEEKKVWASKYFSLNDPFEFNGMYLDEEKISASGNDVGTFYEYFKHGIPIYTINRHFEETNELFVQISLREPLFGIQV